LRLLVLLLLLSGCVKAGPIAVIGDSMTANPYSWANLIIDRGQRMYIMAQAGRSIRDYQMPRDFYAYPGYYSTVVYFLGSSDAYDRTHPFRIKRNFTEHMTFLQERGFTVIVIMHAIYNDMPVQSRQVRDVIRKVTTSLGIPVIDLMVVWDEGFTTDGAHPNIYGHQVLADYIYDEMVKLL